MVSACSRSMGLVMLLAECRRSGLYQSLIQVAMSRRAWARVCQRRRAMSSWLLCGVLGRRDCSSTDRCYVAGQDQRRNGSDNGVVTVVNHASLS